MANMESIFWRPATWVWDVMISTLYCLWTITLLIPWTRMAGGHLYFKARDIDENMHDDV